MLRIAPNIVIGTLVLSLGLTNCDRPSIFDQVLPGNETSSDVTKTTSVSPPTSLEQTVHQQINQYRQSHNLPPLTLDPRISKVARAHSQAMASGKVPFGHAGFEQRVEAINRIIPYRTAAENVAFNKGYSNPTQQAIEGWIKSNGHRINIEGQYNLTGIGVVKNAKGEYYFTQVFIRKWW